MVSSICMICTTEHLPVKKARYFHHLQPLPDSLSSSQSSKCQLPSQSTINSFSPTLKGPQRCSSLMLCVSPLLRGAEGKASIAGCPHQPKPPEEMGHCTAENRTAWGPATLINTFLPEQPGLLKHNVKWKRCVCIHIHVYVYKFGC